ncbi:MAG: twin-arginine translocation signal domain-containing protein [Halomonadaceae bacterium]|uniref:Twin-arginine translocation signal domain-containing protein n=1 Tax=Halomonas colorata TaxID=2742615 RepID=A0ABR9FV15_9GAMM|nr:twin-arginine translocation signal domain-containing protein [Halomonas colorata]MBE0462491.1 twin-arginine translocation signal domain-containing protein [Halomonas colorata]
MLPTYTRRRLLKAATLAGMSVVLVPVSALLPAASAQSQPPAPTSRHTPDSIMVNGWLLRASDR